MLSNNAATESQQQPLSSFAMTMAVTLIANLLVQQGIGTFLRSVVANWGGNHEYSDGLALAAATLILGGPTVLGLYFRPGWRGLLPGWCPFLQPY